MKKIGLNIRASSGLIQLFLILGIALIFSCNKKINAIEDFVDTTNEHTIDSLAHDSITNVTVQLIDIVFEKDEEEKADFNIKTKNFNRLKGVESDKQTASIALPNNFYLVASLHPDLQSKSNYKLGPMRKSANVEGTHSEILDNNIKYKVVIFDKSGHYVTEKKFVNSKKLHKNLDSLKIGEKYTFIVYSANSITSLPSLKFDDPNNKTLKTAKVMVRGDQDFLYFRKDLVLPAGKVFNLEVTLKHLVSQVTIIVDASKTGFPIKQIASSIGPNTRINSVKLDNGEIAKGSKAKTSVIFPPMESKMNQITSYPTCVIADIGISFNISTLQIGSLNLSNLIPIKDFKIKPGLKYILKVKVIPSDSYLTYENWPAARINGVVWSRFNVGIDDFYKGRDPNRSPMTVERHGDYFQWGRGVSAALHNSYRYVSFYSAAGLIGLNNYWNGGPEEEPLKSFVDPCPRGYRIPTKREMQSLIDGTIATNMGDFHGLSKEGEQYTQDFSVAKVFTSKQNKNVTLILPAQGYFEQVKGKDHSEVVISLRGSVGKYYTSFASDDVSLAYLYFDANNVSLNEMPTAGNDVMRSKEAAYVIRCVAGDNKLSY